MTTLQRAKSTTLQSRHKEIVLAAVAAVAYVEQLLEQQTPFLIVPEDYAGHGVSYFSEHDWWYFQAITDDRTCFPCNTNDKTTFTGDELLDMFPYLEIGDENTILAWVHPNCRCILIRISDPLDYLGLDIGVTPDWLPGNDYLMV